MYYFAYGSNMDSARMRDRLGKAVAPKPAKLAGYKLRFNKIASGNANEGYANIVPYPSCVVWGVLYEVSESDLETLDYYEGVAGGHYERVGITVELEDGRDMETITYVACPDKVREGLCPRRKYLDHLLAAQDVLPRDYVAKLKATKTLD